MTEKEIHEAEIEIALACHDPKDRCYLSSEVVDDDFFNRYPDLKPGDKVQYKIDKNTGDIVILGKIHIKKTIIPVKN